MDSDDDWAHLLCRGRSSKTPGPSAGVDTDAPDSSCAELATCCDTTDTTNEPNLGKSDEDRQDRADADAETTRRNAGVDDHAEAMSFLTDLLTAHRAASAGDDGCNRIAAAEAAAASSTSQHVAGVHLVKGAIRAVGTPSSGLGDVSVGVGSVSASLLNSRVATRSAVGLRQLPRPEAGPMPSEGKRRKTLVLVSGGDELHIPEFSPLLEAQVSELTFQHCQAITRTWSCQSIHSGSLLSCIDAGEAELAPSNLASLVNSLSARISRMVAGSPPDLHPAIFKIGLTRDPYWRFAVAAFRHTRDFSDMELLVVSFPALIGFLETALISRLRETQGCQNFLPGGESLPPADRVCYLYVVSKRVDRYIHDRLSRIRADLQ